MSRVTLQSPGLSFLAWLTVSVITAGDLREQEKSAFDVHIRPEAELSRKNLLVCLNPKVKVNLINITILHFTSFTLL